MCDKDRVSLCVKFHWTYHVAKNELLFSEYPDLFKTYCKITCQVLERVTQLNVRVLIY